MSRKPLASPKISAISPKRTAKGPIRSIAGNIISKQLALSFNKRANPGRHDIKTSVTDEHYESALHYAIYNKLRLPLDVNEDGNPISRPAMVNKAAGDYRPLWSIGDRDVGLDLFTIKFVSFHPIDRSVDGADTTEKCASHFESLRGKDEDRNLVDVYRGAIFAYSANGVTGKNRLPRIRVKQIYKPKVILYKTYDEVELLGNECTIRMSLQYPIEGTVLKVFKYKGQVCFSTGSYIKSEYCSHIFAPDYKKIYYALGGPSEEVLFGAPNAKYDTNTHVYIFKIVHPATGQISKLPFKKCIVYQGVEELTLGKMPGVDKINHYAANFQVTPMNYTDLIYSNSGDNTIIGPVYVNPITYEQALQMIDISKEIVAGTRLGTPISDIMYITGSWSVKKANGELEQYIAKFVSPYYENLVIARGPTQNCMAQAVNIAVLYRFMYTQNGQVLPGNDAITTGPIIISLTYKGIPLANTPATAHVSGTDISYSNYDDADVYDIVRRSMLVANNSGRQPAIEQYMLALKNALTQMYYSATQYKPYNPKKIRFIAQEFGSKLGTPRDFIFEGDNNLSDAEAYLVATPSRYQIEKRGDDVGDVILELSKEEYDEFKDNYIDFTNNLQKTRLVSGRDRVEPHNVSLLYLRSKVTDNDRFTHRILDRKTDYLSAKKVLSYFLGAPL